MSSRWSFDAKEQVRQAIDIVDLLGSVVQLRRQGRGYVALCPWHDDTRPSLQVNPERQSFEVLALRHRRRHLQLRHEDGRGRFPRGPGHAGRSGGHQAAKAPAAGTQRSRPRPAGAAAASTSERSTRRPPGSSGNTTSACCTRPRPSRPGSIFRTAASPPRASSDSNSASPRWIAIGSSSRPAAAPGRARGPGDDRRAAPLVRRRQPLRSLPRPRCCSPFATPRAGRSDMGGRVLPGRRDRSARPSTSTRRKRRCSARAICSTASTWPRRPSTRASKTALVMEGYTDVIIAHQFGFNNAVAVLGVALGETHIKHPEAICRPHRPGARRRRSGPEAGQRSPGTVRRPAGRSADPHAARRSRPLRFPAAAGRPRPFAELLATGTVDALDHAFRAATRGLDLDRDIHGASQALERLMAILAKAPRLRPDTTRRRSACGKRSSCSGSPPCSA